MPYFKLVQSRIALFVFSCVLSAWSPSFVTAEQTGIQVDVVVYSATPAGISAALGAAEDDCSVLLVEPTHRIGGLITSGLSHTDYHSRESLSGTFLRFAKRVKLHYEQKYGPNSQQVADCFEGTFAEPKVNLLVLEQLLSEQPRIQVLRNSQLLAVEVTSPNPEMKSIRSVTFKGNEGRDTKVNCQIAIDASYDGDLMAMAGVTWRVGREGQNEYGESLAPKMADDQLQAYNFRFVMTKEPANRVKPEAPDGYR
jgi:FAD dependent oxidoreductase